MKGAWTAAMRSEAQPTLELVPRPADLSPAPGANAARYRSMVESAPAYFYLADPEDSSTLYRSPQAEAMLGYGMDEWSADPDLWVKILHPEDRDRVIAEFAAGAQGVAPFRCEYRLFTKSGTTRWVRDHASIIPDPSGPGMIVQGVVLDITDQKEAQQAAIEASRESEAKSRFLATMSHELRTPLNSVLGFSQLLQDPSVSGDLTDRQGRYVGNIMNSGYHLLNLIGDVLDLAKVQSGQLDITLASVRVHPALASAVAVIRPLAETKELSLDVRSSGDLFVRADWRRLHQVLLNLLSNAVKFTDSGSVLVEAVGGPDALISITVTDTGIGIAQKDLPVIFDEFVQLDRGSTRTYGGTGLGLSLTRRLVQAMGGSVSTVSSLGKGSTFTVLLPAAPSHRQPQLPPPATVP
jgi:PAS domain S-box-containing protein